MPIDSMSKTIAKKTATMEGVQNGNKQLKRRSPVTPLPGLGVEDVCLGGALRRAVECAHPVDVVLLWPRAERSLGLLVGVDGLGDNSRPRRTEYKICNTRGCENRGKNNRGWGGMRWNRSEWGSFQFFKTIFQRSTKQGTHP